MINPTIDNTTLLGHIFSGGMTGVAAFELAAILVLLYYIKTLMAQLSAKDTKLDQVTEDYYKGTIVISEAFNSLNVVLTELKSKL